MKKIWIWIRNLFRERCGLDDYEAWHGIYVMRHAKHCNCEVK